MTFPFSPVHEKFLADLVQLLEAIGSEKEMLRERVSEFAPDFIEARGNDLLKLFELRGKEALLAQEAREMKAQWEEQKRAWTRAGEEKLDPKEFGLEQFGFIGLDAT